MSAGQWFGFDWCRPASPAVPPPGDTGRRPRSVGSRPPEHGEGAGRHRPAAVAPVWVSMGGIRIRARDWTAASPEVKGPEVARRSLWSLDLMPADQVRGRPAGGTVRQLPPPSRTPLVAPAAAPPLIAPPPTHVTLHVARVLCDHRGELPLRLGEVLRPVRLRGHPELRPHAHGRGAAGPGQVPPAGLYGGRDRGPGGRGGASTWGAAPPPPPPRSRRGPLRLPRWTRTSTRASATASR